MFMGVHIAVCLQSEMMNFTDTNLLILGSSSQRYFLCCNDLCRLHQSHSVAILEHSREMKEYILMFSLKLATEAPCRLDEGDPWYSISNQDEFAITITGDKLEYDPIS